MNFRPATLIPPHRCPSNTVVYLNVLMPLADALGIRDFHVPVVSPA